MSSPQIIPGALPFQTNHHFLAAALAQVEDAIIIVDADLRVTYLNAKAARQYEVDAATTLGRRLTELHHHVWFDPGDEEAAMQALAQKGHWRGENLHVLASGKALHVESTVTVLRDDAGTPFMMAVIRDITAQRKVETRLHEAQQWQQLAMESAHLGTWAVDFESREIQCDGRCRQILGIESALPTSAAFGVELLHADDRQRVLTAFAAAISPSSDGIFDVEVRIIRPDGAIRWVAVRGKVLLVAAGGEPQPTRLTGIISDIHERKIQWEQQQRAHRRAALAEAAVHGFIYEWNSLTGTVERSEGVYRMLDYQPGEVAESIDRWCELIHPDDYARVCAILPSNLKQQSHFSIEYRLRHRVGHYVYVWDQGIVERDSDGNPTRVVGITADISERKRMEQVLRETQARFSLAVDKAPLVFAHTDRELRYTWIYNPHPDFRSSQVLGKRDDELGVSPSMRRFVDSKQQVLLRGVGMRREFVFPLSDGERTYDVTIEPLRDTNGDIIGVTTAALDITERKAVEQQVRRNEERLRRMMEGAQVGIAFLRADGAILECNDTFLALLGYTRDEFAAAGLNLRQVSGPEDAFPLADLAERIRQTGLLHPMERLVRQKAGELLAIMVSGAAVHAAEDPGEDEYVVFVVDLTELKRAQAALQELNDTLERRVAERTADLVRSNHELDRFAYVASHDLKSPLRAIDNLASWIAEDAASALPLASQAHLVKLRSRVKRLESLLDDLLLYSRAGRERQAPEAVNTLELVHNIVELLNAPPGMQISIQAELPPIRGERAPLETVLRNLIGNAAKHHHCPEEGTIMVVASVRDEMVEFVVSDNGPGIDPRFHGRIFEVFQTLRPRDEVEGSGMGLAIVKKTVESHGGTVWVESEPGQGAAFHFTWPLDA